MTTFFMISGYGFTVLKVFIFFILLHAVYPTFKYRYALLISCVAADFMRDDPERKVSMYKDNNVLFQKDYFNWLDKVKGIKPEQMQGVLRNNGLHFTVGKNAYSYKIPKKPEDKLTVDNRT